MFDEGYPVSLKENKKRMKNTGISAIIIIAGLSLLLSFGASAVALSDNERYDVGSHEGALQAAHDKVYGGYYNTDCQRYDNSHTHTDAYCQGYVAGYVYNWHALRNDITIYSSVHASQNIAQKAQINCFLAICNNHIGQRASEDQSIVSSTGN